MKNFKNKSTGKVYVHKGTFEQDGKTFLRTGDYSGIESKYTEETEEQPWQEWYGRLTGYDNAVKITEHICKLGGYGNITVGGFYIEGDKEMIKSTMMFTETLDCRYEWSGDHPTKTVDNIVSNLKEQGVI